MQNEDFHVRLEALATFQDIVRDALGAYRALTEQMREVHPSRPAGSLEPVLGHSILPGSTRVLEATRTMLDNYAKLYGKIADAQDVIISRLSLADEALTDTRKEYATHEAKQEAVFNDLLRELPGAVEGGGRGTTRQG